MTPLLTILQAATGIAFLGYGLACLLSPQLRLDFERFGLARFRVLTGALEIAGGLGLLAGLYTGKRHLDRQACIARFTPVVAGRVATPSR